MKNQTNKLNNPQEEPMMMLLKDEGVHLGDRCWKVMEVEGDQQLHNHTFSLIVEPAE